MPGSCNDSATSSGAKVMPRYARLTYPCLRIASTFLETVSIGIASPTPADAPLDVRIAVFTPITRPCESSSGPPEFPGLTDASVWMQPRMGRSPIFNVREIPETIPRLILCSRPNGLPIAYTSCPTSRFDDWPLGTGFSRVMFLGKSMRAGKGVVSEMLPAAVVLVKLKLAGSSRSTAVSVAGSAPTSCARNTVRRGNSS
mmetsp:Transcript_50337/g.100100  ORF Transcript_50337/g.100100 Transcript_50337/m.100100 type:complete len:200 (+) Transcript_50337:1234-1833(+)